MPSSVQGAVSASARLSGATSETDREPARGNVIPRNVNDHRRPPPLSLRLHCNPGLVHGDQVALDDAFGFTCPVPHINPLSVETLVIVAGVQRTLRTRRRHLEVPGPGDKGRVVDQGSDDPADALAVLDGDRFDAVDGHPQGAPRMAGLLDRVQLVAHVFHGGLEEGLNRRYWPCRHVSRCPPTLPVTRGSGPTCAFT